MIYPADNDIHALDNWARGGERQYIACIAGGFVVVNARASMRVKCLVQELNAVTLAGLEPEPLDPESSALTIRPQRLRKVNNTFEQSAS